MPPLVSTRRSYRTLRPRVHAALVLVVLACLAAPAASLLGPRLAGAHAAAPAGPVDLEAVQVTQTTLTLAWTASTDRKVVGYRVTWGELDGVDPDRVDTDKVTYTISDLQCATNNPVEVRAFDRAENLSDPARGVFVTAPCSAAPQTSSHGTPAAPPPPEPTNPPPPEPTNPPPPEPTNPPPSHGTPPPTTSPTPVPPPPSGGGQRFVAPGGSDSSQCSQSAPCRSFARAYQVASPGDVVEVAGGSYPGQRLTLDPSKTSSADVVFVPAPGATPTFPVSNSLNFGSVSAWGAKHVELRGFKMGDVGVQCTQDVTLRNMDVGILNIVSSQQVDVLGGDYGPWVDGVSHVAKNFGSPGCASSGQNPGTSDILIDGALFHDYTISNTVNHSECLQQDLGRLDRLVIRNSTFRNCTDFGILFNGNAHDVLIENNFFDEPMPGNTPTVQCSPNCARGSSSIRFSDKGGTNPSTNLKIRYNSFLGGISIDPANAGVVVKGNIGPRGQCQSNVSFSFNVWSGVKCSPSDRVAALSSVFVGATSALFDLRLRAGSAAIGAGDPLDYPSRDLEGESRPQGAVDAGADERP